MSKLGVIRQYSYSPAAGGLFTGLIGTVGKFIGKGLGIIKPAASKAAQAAVAAAKTPVGQTALLAGGAAAASALMRGGGGSSGATGYYGVRRRGRGITARELRGYRKVARLLHQEGMVSRRARGRH